MLLETFILGGILYTALKSRDKFIQKFKSPPQKPSNKVSKYPNLRPDNDRQLITSSLAVVCSIGGIWYGVLGLLSIPLIIYTNLPISNKTYQLLKQGKVGVTTIISLTILGCLVWGYLVIASLITFLFECANSLTKRVISNSKQQLFGVFEQHPNLVWIVVEGVEIEIPFQKLEKGNIVVVHAGEVIPADGLIVEGIASLDQHILTGEGMPVEKGMGEEVFAATVVLSGKIYVKVEKAGNESTVAKIIQIVDNSADFKSMIQLRSEIISEQLVVPALLVGGLTWPILGMNTALAVINCHPKDRLMFIAPLSILNYFKEASQQGILIKDGRSLELLNRVDTLVFDKTGTLTNEQPHVGAIYRCSEYTDDQIIGYAAAAEYKQKHPLAKAIIQEAENRQLPLPIIEDSAYKIGYGLSVIIAGKTIRVGSKRFVESEGIQIPDTIQQQYRLSHEAGYTLVMVAVDQQLMGAIELLPTVRPEAQAIIHRLKQRSQIKKTYIISGDNEIPTRKLAQELGIDHYFAETLPEHKAELIEHLQQQGYFIAYIGDGINDSIALKKAQVSISLAGASTVATDTAQIVLMANGLQHLDSLFQIADRFHTNMNTTFWLTLTPSVIGLGGVVFLGFGLGATVVFNLMGLLFGLSNVTAVPKLQSFLGKNAKLLPVQE
jgi:Cu2+-exporting ATPase